MTLDPAVASAVVPTMMLQTLVENAVKHGVAAVRGTGRIEVSAAEGAGGLSVEVSDNGPGPEGSPDPSLSDNTGYGLRNIRERLEGYFGEDASLTLTRHDDRATTVAAIRMPLSTQLPPPGGGPLPSPTPSGAGA